MEAEPEPDLSVLTVVTLSLLHIIQNPPWDTNSGTDCMGWMLGTPGVTVLSLQGGSQALPAQLGGLMECCLLEASGGFLLPAHLCFPSPLVLLPLLSAVPSPFPALRLSVFGGDYAVLTLEYELGESGSQILELGEAGAQAGIQEWLEHLCLGCSRCPNLPPTRK